MYHLLRGNTLLGSVNPDPEEDNFPWQGGTFVAFREFARVKELFDRELQMIEADEMDQWEEVWAEIEGPGLRLVPINGGEPMTELVIHVQGPNVRANREPTAGRQARTGENVPRTARPGLVACRWRSA